MDPFTIASLGLGAVGGIGKFLFGSKQDKLADAIDPRYIAYQKSPYAQQQLGIATNLFNGRMAGAGALERNIANSQANQMANIGRNATDSSTALALGAAAQGQANDAYQNLAIKESQNKYNLLDNLNAAYGANIREGDKVYQDQMRKYETDMAAKSGLRASGAQNRFGAINDLASMGIMAGQLGNFGGNNNTTDTYNASMPSAYKDYLMSQATTIPTSRNATYGFPPQFITGKPLF